jgi:uncharacterized membrane protein YfcA
MTPILVILFGFSPEVAIGADIAHGAIFKTLGAVQNRLMGNVRAQLAGWLLLWSAPRAGSASCRSGSIGSSTPASTGGWTGSSRLGRGLR